MLTHRGAALKNCSYSLLLLHFRAVDFWHDVIDLQPELLQKRDEKECVDVSSRPRFLMTSQTIKTQWYLTQGQFVPQF